MFAINFRLTIVVGIIPLLLYFLLAIDGNFNERTSVVSIKKTQPIEALVGSSFLNMTLFADKCAGENSKTYITPTNKCYSSTLLFPNDPSRSGKDVYDTTIVDPQTPKQTMLIRTFYDTEDGTCRGAGDVFRIPLNECVGPFGKPRPWGIFRLVQQQQQKKSDSEVQ
mmetsp:Transcript_26447/g.57957  ORF Transcript_26447/g.57957 Transcript_26447/m.57957 type:complete len:167 (+) Transcript_26447:91-591(+)